MKKFYFSLAAGSQYKTARLLNYPYVLINHQSQTNHPPNYEYESLFVDCGGFSSSFQHGGYTNSDEDYLEYVKRVNPELFALRDYPCEPQLLKEHGWTVREQQEKTLINHLRLIDLMGEEYITAKPIPVIQGWTIEDYLYCIDLYRENGLISDYMAIGSVCRRNATKDIIKVILTIREALPKKTKLHGFGVKKTILKDGATWNALYSVDSGAWDYEARWKKLRGELEAPEASYICGKRYAENIEQIKHFHEGQTVLMEAEHGA